MCVGKCVCVWVSVCLGMRVYRSYRLIFCDDFNLVLWRCGLATTMHRWRKMISSMGAMYCGPYICIAASKMCPVSNVVNFSTRYYYISFEGGQCPHCCKRTGASAPIAPMVPLPMTMSANIRLHRKALRSSKEV